MVLLTIHTTSTEWPQRFEEEFGENRTHLHAREGIHSPLIALPPDIERLSLLHYNAWWHCIASRINKRAVLV